MRNWKEICAKCADGEIEPECEYYGEPNGCNSPTYQEHPPVGDAAAMREALRLCREEFCAICENSKPCKLKCVHVGIIDRALAAPVRNCDRFNAAAMREALRTCRNIAAWIRSGNASVEAGVERIQTEIDKALAAPPRNCDRFADETDAQIAFLNEVWLISVTKETALERDRFENWTDEMRSRYAKWLFAPAAEKGASDGK